MFESLKNLLKHFSGNQNTETAQPVTSNQEIKSAAPESNIHELKTMGSQYNTLAKFNLGLGSIGPANRTDIDPQRLNEMYQAIASGKYNVPVKGAVPEICVDGRTDKDGKRLEAPSAAGGTLSVVYGGDLAGAFATDGVNELQLTSQVINTLKSKGHGTGVHGDDHSSCGCGACAKAKTIYQHITERINDIASLVSQYGINLDDTDKQIIVQQANNRLNQADFFADDRATVLNVAQQNGAIFEELVGAHNELGIALNTKPGTTVDRSAIRKDFGDKYDMFVVDAWAFGNAAKDINTIGTEETAQRIAKAITLQNVATASILGHGSLQIVPIA